MHSTESRFVTGPSTILFASSHVCTFQPGNFTGWGSEVVKNDSRWTLHPISFSVLWPTATISLQMVHSNTALNLIFSFVTHCDHLITNGPQQHCTQSHFRFRDPVRPSHYEWSTATLPYLCIVGQHGHQNVHNVQWQALQVQTVRHSKYQLHY